MPDPDISCLHLIRTMPASSTSTGGEIVRRRDSPQPVVSQLTLENDSAAVADPSDQINPSVLSLRVSIGEPLGAVIVYESGRTGWRQSSYLMPRRETYCWV